MRTLSIGKYVDCTTDWANWNSEANLKDYELVFMNLLSLERDVGNSSLSDTDSVNTDPFPNSKSVGRHLIEGHDIVVILPKKRDINRLGGQTRYLFDWLPTDVNIIEESGESVKPETIPEEWKWYFDGREFDWTLYAEPNPEQEGRLRHKISPIVLNIFNSSVACELKHEYSEDGREFRSVDGSVYLLPLLPSYSYQEFVSSSLRYNFGEGAATPDGSDSPPWVEDYSVPNEDAITTQIDDLESEIAALKSEQSEKEDELEQLERCKMLLYEGDTVLEDLVVEALDEVGFDVEEEISHGRDGLVRLDNEHIVLETHGTTGGIPKDKCRQLNEWVDDYQSENPQTSVEGLFIVNPLKKQAPESRNGYLDLDVEGYMENSGYRIALTEELYKMVINYRNNKIDYSEIKSEFQDDDLMLRFEGLSY